LARATPFASSAYVPVIIAIGRLTRRERASRS
jgi:hypothetical protein